jgi:type I restriction enzyme S subunit
MARALFKSWFVDFDPVRAKAASKQPTGMDAETAALFPSEFVESEEGQIPKGWPVSRIGDTYCWSRESLEPADNPTGTFEHFSLPAFDNGRVPSIDLGAAIKSLKLIVMPESVLVSKLNPSICRVWLPFPSGQRIAVSSTEFLVAVPNAGTPRSWLYEAFTSDPIREALVGQASGTSNSHQRVRPDDVDAIPVALAGPRLLARFDAAASPLLHKTNAVRVESVRLAQIRDTLLPRLLSGELRVPDAERIVGTAT